MKKRISGYIKYLNTYSIDYEGGHVNTHISQCNKVLKDRCKSGESMASTFETREDAERLIKETVLGNEDSDFSNLDELSNWAIEDNDMDPYALYYRFEKPTGRLYHSKRHNWNQGPKTCYEVAVVFYKDWPDWAESPKIKILTAYPTI